MPSIAVHTLHTHTCTHCHVTPRVNLFTCTSVHWSVWKPKLHISPLARIGSIVCFDICSVDEDTVLTFMC